MKQEIKETRLSDEEARLAIRRAYLNVEPMGFTNNQGEIITATKNYKLPDFKEKEFQTLLDTIKEERDVQTVLELIFYDLNARVRFGNAKAIQDKDAPTWTYIHYTPYVDERLYSRMGKVMAEKSFTQKMENATKLVTEIKQSHNVEKMKSLHRHIKDLANISNQ